MNKGFTLIETIIYIAIIGGIIASFTSFSLSISALRNKNSVIEETQANARIALNAVSDYIRLADKVIAPGKGESSGQLVLTMPGNEEITIKSIDDSLSMQKGSQAPLALVSSSIRIEDLEFSNNSEEGYPDNVRIDMASAYRYDSSLEFRYRYQLETSINLKK